MSKNSKKLCHEKKITIQNFLTFFLQFFDEFFLCQIFASACQRKKNELSKNVCQNSKIEEFNVELS